MCDRNIIFTSTTQKLRLYDNTVSNQVFVFPLCRNKQGMFVVGTDYFCVRNRVTVSIPKNGGFSVIVGGSIVEYRHSKRSGAARGGFDIACT